MTCPNCSLNNPPGARFCANCGTTLTPGPASGANAPYTPPGAAYTQSSTPYNIAGRTRMSTGRAIGLGCLVLIVLFFLLSLSCTRACLFPRRHVFIRRVY